VDPLHVLVAKEAGDAEDRQGACGVFAGWAGGYLGNERINDVTTHPAFRHAVHTVAMLYDMKADPAYRETMTYEEDSGCHRARTCREASRPLLVTPALHVLHRST
jgi:hypothetical protein